MLIIFCNNPLKANEVDIDYNSEYNASSEAGFTIGLISYEDLVFDKNIVKSLKKINYPSTPETAIYRGWMLKPHEYELLYNGLLVKNTTLINSPAEYCHCHYLPQSYPIIQSFTPRSIWIDKELLDDRYITLVSDTYKNSPIMIKDYVKSRKHEWNDACYIPDASNAENVKRVVDNFLRLQGNDLNGGIVFREFLKLNYLTNHSISKMPLPREYRLFFLNKKLMKILKYWDEGNYGIEYPDVTNFISIAQQIKSNFFTMDIAQLENGDWIIIEVGDGQVSGLADNADVTEFYQSLKKIIVWG